MHSCVQLLRWMCGNNESLCQITMDTCLLLLLLLFDIHWFIYIFYSPKLVVQTCIHAINLMKILLTKIAGRLEVHVYPIRSWQYLDLTLARLFPPYYPHINFISFYVVKYTIMSDYILICLLVQQNVCWPAWLRPTVSHILLTPWCLCCQWPKRNKIQRTD